MQHCFGNLRLRMASGRFSLLWLKLSTSGAPSSILVGMTCGFSTGEVEETPKLED